MKKVTLSENAQGYIGAARIDDENNIMSKDADTVSVNVASSSAAGSSKDKKQDTLSAAPRKITPPIYNRTRGNKSLALEIAKGPMQRAEAIRRYRKDIKSAGDTSKFNKVTWTMLHTAWWAYVGITFPAFPLTPDKIEGVGCSLKPLVIAPLIIT